MNYIFDTTYILPSMKINVDIDNIGKDMVKVLKSTEITRKIVSVSLIEGKWKCISEYNKSKNKNFLDYANNASNSFYYNSYFEIINPWMSREILNLADSVLKIGHSDYMDCLILATAKFHKYLLISEDKEFEDILDQLEWDVEVINWKKFKKKHSKIF